MKRKIIIIPIGILTAVYVSLGVFLFLYQNSFLYPADKTAFEICPELEKFQKISDGNFRGYYIDRSVDKVIIYYHGNGGRACDRSHMDRYFEPLGYSVLFVEYPGYAETDKEPSMESILAEVISVNDFVTKRKFKEVLVIGESIGTGPASYHAYLTDNNVTKLILITPYNTMAEVARSSFPLYPTGLMIRDNYTPNKWLENSSLPINLIIAENDEMVGKKTGLRLFENISSPLKEIKIIKGAGHNSIYNTPEFSDYFSKLL